MSNEFKRILLLASLALPIPGVLEESIFKPYRLVIFLLVGVGIVTRNFGNWDKSLVKNAVLVQLIGYFGFFVSVFYWDLYNGDYYSNFAMHITLNVAICILLTGQDVTREKVVKLVQVWHLFIIFGALISWIANRDIYFGRFNGQFQNPNTLAMGLSPGVWLYVLLCHQRMTFGRIGILVFTIFLVFVTGSRSSLLINFAVIVYIGITQSNGKFWKNLLSLLVVGFTILVIAEYGAGKSAVISTVLDRYETQNIDGGGGRIAIWYSAMNVSKDTHFLGIGPMQYRCYHSAYIYKLGLMSNDSLDHPLATHSDYVELIVGYGILGFLVYLSFIYSRIRRVRIQSRRFDSPAIFFYIGAFLFQFFSNALSNPIWWVIISFAFLIEKAAYQRPVTPMPALTGKQG